MPESPAFQEMSTFLKKNLSSYQSAEGLYDNLLILIIYCKYCWSTEKESHTMVSSSLIQLIIFNQFSQLCCIM